MNYYNEFDPKAAEWLRELIEFGLIPKGDVDERSICDVRANELLGYTQCHFFAGIGGWSRALHIADWSDDRPVWTGSCPCQPFSDAGKGLGTADERHLWPAWFSLISECRPPVIFGEQVASKAALEWFDGVSTDLERTGYACGAADLCAASVWAPHIRQRLFWVGDSNSSRPQQRRQASTSDGHGRSVESDGGASNRRPACTGHESARRRAGCGEEKSGRSFRNPAGCGAWSNFDIIPCRDGKARRIEPGTFPLVDGIPKGVVPVGDPGISEVQATPEGRVMRLKGYGNAIVPELAAEFIAAYMEIK